MSRSPACDVAIVGAGIIGLSIAFHLLEDEPAPPSIVLIDRAGVGEGASGVQPGGVRQQWSSRVNCQLARESLASYLNIGERLSSSASLNFEPCGYMFLAHSDTRLNRLVADVIVQNHAGVPSEILTPSQAVERVPDMQVDSIVGAAWCQEDGYFDRPQAVVAAFAEASVRLGAEIKLAEVASLDRDGAGWRLPLSGGEVLRAERVVVATGYETPGLLAPLGIEVPITGEPRYLFLSQPIRERLLDPLVVSGEHSFAAKQLANGRVLASDTAASGDPNEVASAWRGTIRARIEELLPRLIYVSFPILVEGHYDTTPDHQPIVSEVLSGLWIAAGFSGHGFMLAPAIGRRVAARLAGADTDELLDWFATQRFDAPSTFTETDWVV
ncbi:MAG: NAD(P)/FAD-dependent oxidoreductase [Solirubrobacteraceae bacterium]